MILARINLPFPTFSLGGEEGLFVANCFDCWFIFCKGPEGLESKGFGFGFCHVENWEHGSGQALLNFPLIGAVCGLYRGCHIGN